MNKDLLLLVEKLSQADPKTLTQKTIKASEECGELAKAVLSYVGAEGAKHKFADKQNILEEVADVMLVALSIGYNLGFSSEQIENMLLQKSTYWAKIQAKEKKSPFPIPFELHVTINHAQVDVDKFKNVCSKLEVKPIVLELIKEDGTKVIDEVMTSSRFFGDNVSVQEELDRISSTLSKEGFEIVRKKIETAPWHPAAPSGGLGKMKEGNYFEAHLDIKVKEESEADLKALALSHGALISHNLNKKYEGYKVYILTLRVYKGFLEEFEAEVSKLYQELLAKGLEVERPNIEYSFYDSKVTHDQIWSKS